MYWIDLGSKAKIERAFMSGNNRMALIEGYDLGWPNGLTISGKRLYWIDGKADKVSHDYIAFLLSIRFNRLSFFTDGVERPRWEQSSGDFDLFREHSPFRNGDHFGDDLFYGSLRSRRVRPADERQSKQIGTQRRHEDEIDALRPFALPRGRERNR